METIDTLARLRVSGRVDNLFADLYIPRKVWWKLLKELKGNRLTVALRFEGEDGTTILDTLSP